MGNFSTPKLDIHANREGNYQVRNTEEELKVAAVGQWRNRPRGKRLFTAEEIRAIRRSKATQRHLAKVYDCSHVTIFYIKKKAIYSDVK